MSKRIAIRSLWLCLITFHYCRSDAQESRFPGDTPKRPCVELRSTPVARFTDLAFNADASLIAGSKDGEVLVFGFESRKVKYTIAHQGVSKVIFSPSDANLLVTGDRTRTIRVWRLGQTQPLRELRGHKDAITHLILDSANRRLASLAQSELRVWDLRSGQELHQVLAEKKLLRGPSFSSHGSLLAYCDEDVVHVIGSDDGRKVSSHQMKIGQLRSSESWKESREQTWGANTAFVDQDQKVVVAGWLATKRFFDGSRDKFMHGYGLTGTIDRTIAAQTVIVNGTGGCAFLGVPSNWEKARPAPVLVTHSDRRSLVAFELTYPGDNGRSSQEKISLCDSESGRLLWSIDGFNNINGSIRAMALSMNPYRIGVCIDDCIRIWSIEDRLKY